MFSGHLQDLVAAAEVGAGVGVERVVEVGRDLILAQDLVATLEVAPEAVVLVPGLVRAVGVKTGQTGTGLVRFRVHVLGRGHPVRPQTAQDLAVLLPFIHQTKTKVLILRKLEPTPSLRSFINMCSRFKRI